MAYVGSKFGATRLTRATAAEFGPENIRVNSIHPSSVMTPMVKEIRETNPEFAASFDKTIPMRSVEEPEEIASMVIFSTSDEASYVNGLILPSMEAFWLNPFPKSERHRGCCFFRVSLSNSKRKLTIVLSQREYRSVHGTFNS